jgi:hypothetical protein
VVVVEDATVVVLEDAIDAVVEVDAADETVDPVADEDERSAWQNATVVRAKSLASDNFISNHNLRMNEGMNGKLLQ